MSAIGACLYGVTAGLLYPLVRSLLSLLRGFFIFPIVTVFGNGGISAARMRWARLGGARLTAVAYNVYDFLFFSTAGAGLILLIYGLLDGMFRFYMPIIATLAFAVIYRSAGRRIGKVLSAFLRKLSLPVILLMALVLQPLYLLVRFVRWGFERAVIPFFKNHAAVPVSRFYRSFLRSITERIKRIRRHRREKDASSKAAASAPEKGTDVKGKKAHNDI